MHTSKNLHARRLRVSETLQKYIFQNVLVHSDHMFLAPHTCVTGIHSEIHASAGGDGREDRFDTVDPRAQQSRHTGSRSPRGAEGAQAVPARYQQTSSVRTQDVVILKTSYLN